MRCLVKCVANSLQLSALADYFKHKKYEVDLHRDVLHVSYANKELFFFAHGAFVSWGLSSKEEQALAEAVTPFAKQILNLTEARHFLYRYENKTRIYLHKRFQLEVIALASTEPELKLAISYGLGQSIKLESYEETVKNIIQINTPLFEALAKTGKVLLSKKEITIRLGQIFLTRSSVNLNSEYLDVPEYFWEYPHLEKDYLVSVNYLDLQSRVSALNQQLDVLHELFNMLNGQLQHQHTSFLEIIIIVLISVETILSIVQIGWLFWKH